MTSNDTVERGSALTLLGDFIALTKPRVMSLLLVSAVAGAFIGAGSTPTSEVILAVLVGGALASGGAAAGISGPADWGYLSGNGLLSAISLGRIAGLASADLVHKN